MAALTPPAPPRLLPLGDGAWTVEFGHAIDPALNARVMALAARVQAARATEPLLAPVLDVVPTFRSLSVHFDPWRADTEALGRRLLALAAAADEADKADVAGVAAAAGTGAAASAATRPRGRRWRLPVCFDADFGPDLAALAAATGLAPAQVTALLTQATLRVYMIGFLPGFPYLGGLPPALARPRLATPRQRVPARSVAVADTMCCVYPWDSPGGWHLLGRTPLPLFDAAHPDGAAWLAAGDQLRWQAVDRATHDRIARDFAAGTLRRADFLDPADDAPAGAAAAPAGHTA